MSALAPERIATRRRRQRSSISQVAPAAGSSPTTRRGDFVAQFDRQFETRFCDQACAELERRLADRPALRVERSRHAVGARVSIRAGKPHLQRAGKALDVVDRDRRRALGSHGDRVALGQRLQFCRKAAGAAEFEAVGDPQDLGLGIRAEETRYRRQRGLAGGRIGNRRQSAKFRLEIRRVERRDVQAALGHRRQRCEAARAGRRRHRFTRDH